MVSISFGRYFDLEERKNLKNSFWVFEGLREAFNENWYDFEEGINKAKQIAHDNPSLTYQQALFEVFGHFSIIYEVDGKKIDLDLDIDADKEMYSIIVDNYG